MNGYKPDELELAALVGDGSGPDVKGRQSVSPHRPLVGRSRSAERIAAAGGEPILDTGVSPADGTACRTNDVPGKGKKLWWPGIRHILGQLLLANKLSILLLFVPVSIVADVLGVGKGWLFIFSLFGIAPLAERLGFVTEQLSTFVGPTLGGLLNATFGNATEMIISIFALQSNLVRVVQLSLLGSILSNMLLVLGCAFFAGGLRKREQLFNKTAAMVNAGLLLMAVMGLVLPAVLQATHTEIKERSSELAFSRFSACVMLVAYAFFLFFQLKSHSHLYDEELPDMAVEEERESTVEDDEEQVLSFWGCTVWLGVITLFISILSGYLVISIEGAAESWNIPVAFISVIMLPIVGNAAEHASAILFAMKDKLDISLGVAIGSSTQIAMFAIPFCVVIAWCMDVDMDLNFHIFETATLFITVIVVTVLLQEGQANYFKGLMLVLCYLIVAASFFVHRDTDKNDDKHNR